MDNKVDAVILFVDMNDQEWRDRYNEYIKLNNIPLPEINNMEVRSRDYGTLRCLIRSIEKNLDWINNVFLVVQSESQVPEWINRETVKVVLHEEFIPKEYLPLYNSFSLSIHLHLIKGLSEKFLVISDDSIIANKMEKEDFFIGDKLVTSIRSASIDTIEKSSSKNTHYFKLNTSNVARMLCDGKKDNVYYYDFHAIRPMFKSLMNNVYNKLDIKKYVSPFRERYNIYINVFIVYAFLTRKIILRTNNNAYIDFKNKDVGNFRKWINKNAKKKQLSINDQELKEYFDKELFYKMVEETLQHFFPEKSKRYER